MSTKIFNTCKEDILAAWLASGIDLRVALLSSNTTADTENDGIVYVDDITTLDEFDGANYTRKSLASEAVSKDDSNDRAALDAEDITWTALGAGTRNVVGVLVYKHVTDDTDSEVCIWLEYPTPKVPDGSDFKLNIADILRAS